MKKRKVAVLLLIFGIVLIALGIGIYIYDEVINTRQDKKQLQSNISENYEIFKKSVDYFNATRTTYYSEVVENLFPETVEDEYDNWITILDDYTKKVDEVEKSSSYLKKECINKYHSNKDITNKCNAFIIAYETVINYYTKDINSFNEVLTSYRREYDEKNEIKDYSSKYDYIDINLDGEFIGKN